MRYVHELTTARDEFRNAISVSDASRQVGLMADALCLVCSAMLEEFRHVNDMLRLINGKIDGLVQREGLLPLDPPWAHRR